MTTIRRSYARDLRAPGGFLPEHVPAAALPEPFDQLVDAAGELPSRYEAGTRRWLDTRFANAPTGTEPKVNALSDADAETLAAVLAVLGHAYRWDRLPPAAERFDETTLRLPDGLAAPWQAVSARLGHPMVGSVYSIHTANWRSRSLPAGSAYHGSQLQFDDLDVAFPWLTGERGEDLRTMSLAFVLMEARGATVISHLVDAIDAAIRHDLPEASNALVDLARAVGEMAAVFVVVVRPKLIAVDHWLEWIQPHGGWAVDTGDGESHLGASGLQVGALQCLDIALGVGGDSTIARGYRPARRYLPSRFQAFLEALDAVAHVLPEFVESSRSATVKQAHADCLGEMQRFRRAHKARGAQYLSGDVPGHAPRRSTGLSTPYRGGADPVTAFEATMQERIDETGAARLETDLDDAGVAATFQYLTEPELRALLACGHDERALAGQVIFAAGENLDSLYRLDDGMLRVLDADGALVGRIWPGEVFGEIELLTAGHATTTVIADVDAELRNIPHRELFDLLRSDPNLTSRFYQSLAALLARRLEATMALIRDTAPQPGASDIDLRDADAGASQRA